MACASPWSYLRHCVQGLARDRRRLGRLGRKLGGLFVHRFALRVGRGSWGTRRVSATVAPGEAPRRTRRTWLRNLPLRAEHGRREPRVVLRGAALGEARGRSHRPGAPRGLRARQQPSSDAARGARGGRDGRTAFSSPSIATRRRARRKCSGTRTAKTSCRAPPGSSDTRDVASGGRREHAVVPWRCGMGAAGDSRAPRRVLDAGGLGGRAVGGSRSLAGGRGRGAVGKNRRRFALIASGDGCREMSRCFGSGCGGNHRAPRPPATATATTGARRRGARASLAEPDVGISHARTRT